MYADHGKYVKIANFRPSGPPHEDQVLKSSSQGAPPMTTTHSTLALEKFLTDPRSTPILRAIREAQPSHHRDQIDAARRHTEHSFQLLASLLRDSSETWTDLTDSPTWLRLDILSRITGLINGTADTCRHGINPDQPQPVFAAACKPNLVACSHCLHLLAMPKGSRADATCDGCGHVCAGPEHGDGIFPGI